LKFLIENQYEKVKGTEWAAGINLLPTSLYSGSSFSAAGEKTAQSNKNPNCLLCILRIFAII